VDSERMPLCIEAKARGRELHRSGYPSHNTLTQIRRENGCSNWNISAQRRVYRVEADVGQTVSPRGGPLRDLSATIGPSPLLALLVLPPSSAEVTDCEPQGVRRCSSLKESRIHGPTIGVHTLTGGRVAQRWPWTRRGPRDRKLIPLRRTESLTARFRLRNKQVEWPCCQWRGDVCLRCEDCHHLSQLPHLDPCERQFHFAAPTSASELPSPLDPCTGFAFMGALRKESTVEFRVNDYYLQVYVNTLGVSRRLNPVTHRKIAFSPPDVCCIPSLYSMPARKCS
jgi:hypothetical protein